MATGPAMDKFLSWTFSLVAIAAVIFGCVAAAAGIHADKTEIWTDVEEGCYVQELNDNEMWFVDNPTTEKVFCPITNEEADRRDIGQKEYDE